MLCAPTYPQMKKAITTHMETIELLGVHHQPLEKIVQCIMSIMMNTGAFVPCQKVRGRGSLTSNSPSKPFSFAIEGMLFPSMRTANLKP